MTQQRDMSVQEAVELAWQHHQAGRLGEAESIYRQILAVYPNHPDALRLFGILESETGRADSAADHVRRAIAIAPENPQYHSDLGHVMLNSGRFAEALEAFQKVMSLLPNHPGSHCNLGVALQASGRPDEALIAFRKAISLQPDMPQAHCHLGSTLKQLGDFDSAIDAYRHSISLWPDYALAHYNLGLVLLMKGKLSEGFSEYEWRLRVQELHRLRIEVGGPQWNGEELGGKRILLHAEQAFGDTIQFARYAAEVGRRGAKVLIACQPELVRLFNTLEHVEAIYVPGDPVPNFDLHCPMMSLATAMKTTLETIPANVPYLRADAELSTRWRKRMSGNELKVGLCWAGLPAHKDDKNRSLPLSVLSPLMEVANIHFFSLQKGDANRQASESSSLRLTDWTEDLLDFADTAALIDNLDLVITVDTSVANLAGAMGKPVWVLLPFVPDWRWMLDRNDSPWYPTLRLFRQTKPGNWTAVVQLVIESLQRFTACP